MPDPFGYEGKHVLVVGGATGMGEAAASIAAGRGARVTVLDLPPDPAQPPQASALRAHTHMAGNGSHAFLQVDLREQGQIDAALAQIDGPVDAVVSAAGVADGTPGLMKVNFIGHRHILEALVDDGRLSRGGAIAMISSVAGLGWESQIPTLTEFLATPDYAAAAAWVDGHEGTDTYVFSKQVMNCYVARRSFPLMAAGIRINAVCPAPTDTPLARANAEVWLAFAQDYRDATGTEHLRPEQIGNVLTFLNSDAADAISGVNLLIDNGYIFSSLSGGYEPGHELAKLLLGK